jgi:hypothetical protein
VTDSFDGTSVRFFAPDGSPVERESSLEKPTKQDIDSVKVIGNAVDLLSHAKSDHPDIEKVFGSAKTAALRHLAHHLPDISSPFSDIHKTDSVQGFLIAFVDRCWQRPKIADARRVCDTWQQDDRLAGLPLSPQAVDAIRQWTEYRWGIPSLLESGNFEPDEETAGRLEGCSPLNNLPLGHRLFDPKADGADELAYLLETSPYDYLTWLNKEKKVPVYSGRKRGRGIRGSLS